ncbi:hypothetical protein ES703_50287 [subsurface metagenome]
MVDIVGVIGAVINHNDVSYYLDDVFFGQGASVLRNLELQALVELIAPHLPQVVAQGVEEEVLYQLFGVLDIGRVARAQLSIDIEQGFGLVLDHRLALHGRLDKLVVGHVVLVGE